MRKRGKKIRDTGIGLSTCWSTNRGEPWLETYTATMGNTVTVQQPVVDDEPDEEYERNFQRGLQLLEAKLKENDPLA
nr:hypothetical protein [Escherichia coli]